MQLSCKSNLAWPPVGKGFSLTMWLRVEEKKTSEFTLGNGGAPRTRLRKSKSTVRLGHRNHGSTESIGKISKDFCLF